MRPGPLEIVLIIVIIAAIVIAARIFRSGLGSTEENNESATNATANPSQADSRVNKYLNRTGIAFIIGGIIALLAAVSFFRWAFQSYLWAAAVIVIGFIIVFLTRKKR